MRCGSCKGSHAKVVDVQVCYSDAAEARAEAYAEAGMSWIAGGGSPEDARYYARVIASGQTWEEHLAALDAEFAKVAEAAGTCEHGLSAALCEGPQHYPMDM